MLNWLEEILPFCCSKNRKSKERINTIETDSNRPNSIKSGSSYVNDYTLNPACSQQDSEYSDSSSEEHSPTPDFYFSFHSGQGPEEKSNPFSTKNDCRLKQDDPLPKHKSLDSDIPHSSQPLRRVRTDPLKQTPELARFIPKVMKELPVKQSDGSGENKTIFNESSKSSTVDSRRNSRKAAVVQEFIESANSVLGKNYLEQFECVDCQQSAKGFCIGCPGKRFCEECYESAHVSLSIPHKFCEYKIFKKQLLIRKSIIKLQSCN
jgi:hypothetical protein